MAIKTDSDYRVSHQGKNFGRVYQKTLEYAWQKMLLNFERNSLVHVFRTISVDPMETSCLDFACGTGRVLTFLGEHFGSVVGVDVSQDMLEVCHERNPDAVLICADVTTSTETLDGRHFDLITAFRFFPNAQPELREKVIKNLSEHLKPGGLLVFNNHRNYSSTLFSIARWIGREMTSMKVREVRELIDMGSLELEFKEGFGVLPATNQYFLVPAWLHRLIDRIMSFVGLNEYLAQDVLYVCRKPFNGRKGS